MAGANKRQRGSIDTLPNGSLRVRVSAGYDPITQHRHYLTEFIAPGPKAAESAELARTRLLNQVDERRHPRTSATVNQLLDKYLATVDLSESTRQRYIECIDNHIRPFIGSVKAGSIDADILDSLYAELRRCRSHCKGRKRTDHRTTGRHVCDERCQSHTCRPLNNWTIRKVHYVLSAAFKAGMRWRWVSVNPTEQARPPAAPQNNPTPPSPDEAGRILQAAADDPDWAAHLWLAMTTGARRGELCALQWADVDLERGLVALTGFKTGGQKRRIALDAESVRVLTEQFDRYVERLSRFDRQPDPHAYVFSAVPDHSQPVKASLVTQRYKRMVTKLGIDTHLHNLRHYSATELIGAGVDVRTVAGRLGHTDATTTLRIYAAWLSEFDQRAAKHISGRMPNRPAIATTAAPVHPNEVLAEKLRQEILAGSYPSGEAFPAVKQIAADHQVSVGTAHRAIERLRSWGFVDRKSNARAIVTPADKWPITEAATAEAPAPEPPPTPSRDERRLVDFRLIHNGEQLRNFSAEADISRSSDLRALLTSAVRRAGGDVGQLDEYELEVVANGTIVTTFVAMPA